MQADRPAPTLSVDIGYARVPVWIQGEGMPVVFVHGWPLTGDTWREVVAGLGGACRTIVFDLPGAGDSTWDDGHRLSLSTLSDAIVRVVQQVVPTGQFVLVGHNSGGGMARQAAAVLGERVAGMVLCNTEIPHVHSWRFSVLLGAMQWPGAPSVARWMIQTRVGRYLLLRDAVANRALVPALSERFLAPLAASPRRLSGALEVVRGVRPADFDAIGEVHGRIVAPVRLVWGTECVWFPLAGAHAMCATFGGSATLTEVQGAGLLVHEEAPDRVTAVIRDLIATISASAAA